MSNVYEKSLELMDAHFNLVEDDEFLKTYLSVESSKGPLAKEFISQNFFLDSELEFETTIVDSIKITETLISNTFNCYIEKKIGTQSITIPLVIVKKQTLDCIKYDSLYVANDEDYVSNAA